MGRELRKNAPDDVKRDREDRVDEIIARAKRQHPGATPGDGSVGPQIHQPSRGPKVERPDDEDAQPNPPE